MYSDNNRPVWIEEKQRHAIGYGDGKNDTGHVGYEGVTVGICSCCRYASDCRTVDLSRDGNAGPIHGEGVQKELAVLPHVGGVIADIEGDVQTEGGGAHAAIAGAEPAGDLWECAKQS
jgi:hypothetical protein